MYANIYMYTETRQCVVVFGYTIEILFELLHGFGFFYNKSVRDRSIT